MITYKELRKRQRRNNRLALKSKKSRRRFIKEVKKYIKQIEFYWLKRKILSERLFQEFIEEGDTLGCYFKMLEKSNRTLLG